MVFILSTMKLSIFTINIWGLKFVAKNRTARIKALADSLVNNGYDVVCIQELWCEADYQYLKHFCETVFEYIHYFHSGMLGSGMCVMSRYPIIDILYHSFILNGYLHMLLHGDWFGGKGIGLCRINVKGFIVNVYTTHLHACYNSSNDKYMKHRITQAFETANFIRVTSNGSDLTVLAGDLNSDPNEICYKIIRLVTNMKDCYTTCLTNSIEHTFNHPLNSNYNTKETAARLDYILYKFNKNKLVIVKEHRHSLPTRVPAQNYSYSDHEPIEAVFEISANNFNVDRDINSKNDMLYEMELRKIIDICLSICNGNSVENPLISKWHYVFLLICIMFIYYQPLPLSIYISDHYIVIIFILILIFKILCIYNFVVKSIDKNCLRGFCYQMKILYSYPKDLLFSS